MKTILLSLLAIAATSLVFAQTALPTEPSAIERQPLERWLGDWTFETTTLASPFGAGGTNVGACSVLPILAGQNGEFRDKATGPQENLRRIEAGGFDPTRGGFFWDSLAGDTAVIDPAYTFDGTRVSTVGTMRARDKRYLFRSLVTFADDFQSFTNRREISADGMHWTLLSESRAAKVGAILAAPDRDTPQAGREDTSPRSGLAAGSRVIAAANLPATPKRPVSDTYHGVSVLDPYRWLEAWDDPEVKTWSEAQNAAARRVLEALPHVSEIRDHVTEIMTAPTFSHFSLMPAGGKLFALKHQPPRQQPLLVVMASATKPETARVVVDPETINPDGTTTINWFVPSPDGKLVAVSLAQGGSESGDVHVFDVATGRAVFEVVPGVYNGTGLGFLAWLPDSKSFYYTRYPRGEERPIEDRMFYLQLYRHVLGTPTADDVYETGRDFPKIAEVFVETSREGVALVSMQKGDGGEFEHHLRTLDGRWHQLTRYEDRIVQAVLGPSADGRATPVYLVSRLDAPRGKLLRLTVDHRSGPTPDPAKAEVVLPEQDDTLVSAFYLWDLGNILVTRDHIYATYQLGGPSEIRVFDHAGQRLAGPQPFAVGSAGAVVPSGKPGESVLVAAGSYLDTPTWFAFDPKTATTTKLALTKEPPVDVSELEVVREWATSKDGTRVPVNIIRRKGTKLDGSHPCVVTGYGGYGMSIKPAFLLQAQVLLEQGVIWAEANLRGGGEFGDAWHRAGNLTNKQNVFDDFHAVCRHMIDAGYTRSSRLGILGGSNGGLLMGATLTQHPELATCVVSFVGVYDMLRVETSPNGVFNIPEFGTVRDPAQFAALHAYSPYHRVIDGSRYPTVLFLTGANDPRVNPMHSRKMTARLQDAGATCLLRTSADSGHGLDSSLSQRIEETVDVSAFLFAQLGVDFRPLNSKPD